MTSFTSDSNLAIAAIRNKLTYHSLGSADLDELNRLILSFEAFAGPFAKLIQTALSASLKNYLDGRFDDAAAELSLIHNLPLTMEDASRWDESHFYSIELLRYLESASNASRIKDVVLFIAEGQKDLVR